MGPRIAWIQYTLDLVLTRPKLLYVFEVPFHHVKELNSDGFF